MRATIDRAGRILWVLACLVPMWSLSATAQTTWEEKNRAGELLFQQGRLADANRLFLDALQEAQKFGSTDLRLAPIYNNLALVAFVRSSFINSEALYEKALAIVEASRG